MIRATTVQRRLFSIVSATLFMMLPLAQQVLHADGALDPSFGQNGTVTTSFGKGTSAQVADMAIQPDGKIVAIGSFNGGHIAVARYLTDGSLDPAFGDNGRVTATFPSFIELPTSVALQADGKIVVGGTAFVLGHPNLDMIAVRYNADGSVDTSFGTQGLATVDVGPNGRGKVVLVQGDGKIVLVGTTGDSDIAVARINADGSLDTSFAGSGSTVLDLGGVEEGSAGALQADGKIVVGGFTGQSTGVTDFLVARYNTDGTLDPSFGAGGIVTTDLGDDDRILDLAIASDGKIVATGTVVNDLQETENFGVARYNTDGTLDTGFGTGGIVVSDLGFDIEQPNALAVQADHKVVVAGVSNDLTMGVLVRYNDDGSKDSTFGTSGVVRVTTPVSFAAVAIQSDNKILAAGGGTSFVLDRFLGAASSGTHP